MSEPQLESADRPRVAVVDYGAGNLRSVARALEACGAEPVVTDRADDLERAAAVVLPGVGAAGAAMRGLSERGLVGPLRRAVASGKPFLGVCLGLQVLMTRSEEDGGVACLGIIRGTVRRLPAGLKVPHMGWNQVQQRTPHRLFAEIPDGADFYFVHSYVVVPDDPAVILGTTDYGGSFSSVVGFENVVATQFHPEKSADEGLRLYRNFVRWARDVSPSAVVAGRERA
ncbi:MAG TPA: imidazole glycerol phosphate synthase subunit HisH [Chloroflexota bacterium]|nr:imidazole glycerol phosphate synthase subunit HisH [Chloroflexota bacterium]